MSCVLYLQGGDASWYFALAKSVTSRLCWTQQIERGTECMVVFCCLQRSLSLASILANQSYSHTTLAFEPQMHAEPQGTKNLLQQHFWNLESWCTAVATDVYTKHAV